MMEGDYDHVFTDAYEDLDYFDGCDDFDDDPFYEYYEESDGTADDCCDERDEVMSEDYNGRDYVDARLENEDAFHQSHDGSHENMSEASEGSENAGEYFDGTDGDTQSGSEGVESTDEEDDDSVAQRSGTIDGFIDELLEGSENVDDNQSDVSHGSVLDVFADESEVDVFADAQNGNCEDINSDNYEDMVDESDVDDVWDDDLINAGPPWQADDTWDDVITLGDEWYDYDEGDEVWDETADGRYELQYEEYEGDAIPGGDGVGDANDAPARNNFVTRSTTVEAAVTGGGTRDLATAGNTQSVECYNCSCPICLERLDSQEVGSPWNCQHYFCLSCIVEWVQRSNTCPVDRETICKIAVRCRMGSPVTRVVSVMPARLVQEEA